MSENKIYKYYNNLAKSYDDNRFENSYGKYIDAQERFFLQSILNNKSYAKILDLGCGTGRLTHFATHGVDFSEEMIKIVTKKHPEKSFQVGNITQIPFEIKFDCIFCFHVIMHQNRENTLKFLEECHQKITNNGILIFDYPTKNRRRAISTQEDWHASNSFNDEEIKEILHPNWEIINQTGVLFFPIHRFPNKIRNWFLRIDNFICRSFMRKWASYQIVVLKKK